MAEPDYAAERKLPIGKTCADCRSGPRCDGLFGAVRKQFTSCDFWPSRFVECSTSPDGRHQVDTSMESGPNNCFHCEQPMPGFATPCVEAAQHG